MVEIIPAIVPKSYDELSDKLDIVAGHVPFVQIDITDGSYAQNHTWPYLKGSNVRDVVFEEILTQEKALPHWDEIDFEFDLMIRNAHQKIPDFISAGASRIVVHKESLTDEELAHIIRDFGKHSDELGPFDVELGIALLPSDSPENMAVSIANIVDKIHFVQVMGINNLGFQNQPSDARSVELVRALKNVYKDLIVSVDGAVNMDTAKAFILAGADRLVVGSALFESDNFLGTLKELQCLK